MIELRNINILFDRKECIRNGNFKAYPYQITGIYGESGAGKSSLLYILGMLSNQQHEYYYNNKQLILNDKEKAKFRNQHISFITQNSLLIETISVEKNIEYYLLQSQSKHNVDELLEMVNLKDKKDAMPVSLSTGERQRIAIACALAKDSDIILGDELTSALDDENSDIIMKLLRQCASLGKTVILVSHERKVMDKCDRLYKLDHLELTLEKEVENNDEVVNSQQVKEVKPLKMFELLFHSNKKNNRRRLIISFLVMIILFVGCSVYRAGKENVASNEDISVNDVESTKLLALGDESGFYHDTDYGFALKTLSQFELISDTIINEIDNIEHIKKSYDYYIFEYDMLLNTGYSHQMTLKATRDNKVIEKKESDDELVAGDSKSFSIIPFYPEESTLKQDEGVYINSYIAYNYNLKVGDSLELELNVPYAMSKSTAITDDQAYYYSVDMIGASVSYQTKVAGIVEANSTNNEIYLQNDIMENLIDEQIAKYKKGEIKINEDAYQGYSKIIDLQPYAKAIFVDKKENVLKVQNDINKISDKIFAYNEYQSLLELQEGYDKIASDTMKVVYVTNAILLIGAIVIETFYLKKYKSTYMILRLTGFNKKEKQKIMINHVLYQIIMILCLGMLIYLTASLPDVLMSFHYFNLITFISNAPHIIAQYYWYGRFSIIHLQMFIVSIMIVVILINICIYQYYNKKDLIKWIREG